MNSTSIDCQAPHLNALGHGRVTRTMWPPAPGTQRWQARYGADTLLCVRHREDPAGLRRVVTVELVVAEVAPRRSQRRLVTHRLYPVQAGPEERTLHRAIKARGGCWDTEQSLWFVTGEAIRELGLMDRVAINRRPRRRTRPRR